MSILTILVVACVVWILITLISTMAEPDERNDIRADGTNTLLSTVGYTVVLYACMYFESRIMSWIVFILLGLMALIPFAGAVALMVKHEVSGKRIFTSLLSSIVPLFIDACVYINCLK